MLGITYNFIGATAALQRAYLRAGENPLPVDLGVAILAAGVGSLLPDIDEDNSAIRRTWIGDPTKLKGCWASILIRLLAGSVC